MEPADSYDVLCNALLIKDKDKRIQTLRTLIASGVNVNSCCNISSPMAMVEYKGLTVLMVAAWNGYVDCVQVLLDAGANVNQPDVNRQTALLEAVSKKNVECMKLLLEAGADVDHSNLYGRTALIHAAMNGDDKCVKLLIEAGADVNLSDGIGGTALIKAARYGYVECMELLLKLEAGTNLNGVDINGNTLLIRFLKYFGSGKKDKACLKLLINAGVDINAQNNKKLQPIHFALTLWNHFNFLAEYLISKNCNLSQASYDKVKVCANEDLYGGTFKLNVNDRLDMLKLLFVCGLPRHLCHSFVVEQETSIRNWVETVTSQPNTLKSICVFEIRKTLGLGIKSKVTKLNLPNVIQNLILLKGILSLECFD